MSFIKKHKKWVLVIVAGVLVLVMLIMGGVSSNKEKEKQKEVDKYTSEQMNQASSEGTSDDALIVQMQDDLIKSYGTVPEGYVWDLDGSLLSLGDKSMSAEDVLYAYLNGLKSLDFSAVEKFSRDSVVVDTYEGYFSENDKVTDYSDSFNRSIYKQCLLSLKVKGIESSSVFAENKQVFTVKVNMLDLTQKDFWLKDRATIYKNLKIYSSDQADSTKADIYLYDYITRYYQSKKAKTRDVSFDITLQRYPDLDTGWLVSIDTDVDSACRYADGKLVVNYINEEYAEEGNDYLDKIAAQEKKHKNN